jgi:hypothetical protein
MAAPLKVPIAETALRSHEKSQPTSKESVAAMLERYKSNLIANWLEQTWCTLKLTSFTLVSNPEPQGHLLKLVDDTGACLARLKVSLKDSNETPSPAAVAHGNLRRTQSYSAAMLIRDF